jgi:hypothetical protein
MGDGTKNFMLKQIKAIYLVSPWGKKSHPKNYRSDYFGTHIAFYQYAEIQPCPQSPHSNGTTLSSLKSN